MVLIKTEVPVASLPADHPARNDPSLGLSSLPHPATAPYLGQENYQHEFPTRYGEPAQSRVSVVSNATLQDYQMQLLLLEKQREQRLKMAQEGSESKSIDTTRSNPTSSIVSGFRNHTAHSREQIARIAAQHQEAQQQQQMAALLRAERVQKAQQMGPQELFYESMKSRPEFAENQTWHDYQMQLINLERQGKTQLSLTRQQPYQNIGLGQGPAQGNYALQDYQTQLMLLERQKKKRAVRRQQEATQQRHQLQDYQMQLMLLEQQNKKRIMMARAESDAAATAYQSHMEANPFPQPDSSVTNEGDLTPNLQESALIATNPTSSTYFGYQTEPQVVHPCQALPGTPGRTCSPPPIVQEPAQGPTLVIRGGPPSSN